MKKILRYSVALSLLLVLSVWFLGRPEETVAIAQAREATGGASFVTLTDGVTHYRLEGPVRAPLILLIHGGREPLWTWDEVVPALHKAGMRTLRYDMFGRGFSDRPLGAAYDQAFYLRQLEDLLVALRIDVPVDVAGYSFGAAIAVKLANARPQQIRSLTLLAPRYIALDIPAVINVPLLNDALINTVVKPRAMDEVRSFFHTPLQQERYVHRVGKPEHVIGNHAAFKRFVLSDALGSTRGIYEHLANGIVPVLIISGGEDISIPPLHIEAIMKELPRAGQIVYPGANHGLVWQRGQEIAADILEFVAARNRKSGSVTITVIDSSNSAGVPIAPQFMPNPL